MISQHGAMTPPRQTLNYSPKGSRAGTPVRHSRRSVSASTPRRGNKTRRASPGRQRKFSNRVLDVTPLFTLEGAVRYVEVVNEHTAWTAKCDGSVGVRSIPSGNEIRQICGREGAFCTCLLFVEKTGKIWAVFSDGFIRIYDAAIFAFEKEFVQHDGSIECIVALEDRIYTGGRDWKIYQWIPDNYSYERQLSGHGNTVRCFCPYNGSTGAVLFSGSDDGTVKAWNPYAPTKQTKESNPCIHTFLGHSRGVLSLELVTPNNQLWSGGEDSTIRVWDLNSLNCISVLEGHTSPIGSLMLLGNRLWSGDKRGRILLWDINTLLPLQELSQATGMNPRSILCMRTMMSSLVWKVWTTTSSGQIHCWNADSVSMILRNDALEDTSPHMLEESVRVLERDNEFLRGEIAKMARQLEKESARVKQEQLKSAQNRQLAMDASECLRRQVRERARSKSPTSSVGADALDISPQTSYLTPRTRPEESPKPLSEMSHVRWKLGDAMERSSLNLMTTPTTMSIDVDDSSPIVVTNHKRLFPGTAWSEVLATNEKELRSAFAGEVARSIGLTEDRLQHVCMEATPQGLLAAVDIPHTSPTRSDDIQSHLDKYPFPSVIALYGSALEIKNEDLKRSLAQFQKEKDSIREQNNRDNVNDTTTTRAQNRETADILDELETSKREHQELQRRIQQISEQETLTRSNFNIIQEEYDALKNLVEKRLKPRISALERMNGEKDLDLRANEERIKRLKRELEQLQGQRREGQERNGGSNARLQEEYDALKNLVEKRLKPRISELERMNGEKDLDLRANEERIKQLKRELEQLQGQRREGQERNGGSNARLQEEYDALKNLVENRLKPRISELERMNGEKDLDLRANEERIKRLKRELEQLQGQRREGQERNGGSNARLQEEYDALKNLVEKRLKPRISELERMNGEKDLDLRANEERIKQLKRELEQLQGQRREGQERNGGSNARHQEEYDALKNLVENRLKPRISELERMNGEKDLDLRANEERIKQLKRELVQLQGQRREGQERNGGSNARLQEEYDALKNLVENRLKPRISALERMNGEKDLDLRANEERIKQLKRELEQLQGQRREGQERNGGSNARHQEEYDALKNLVENRLKPRISELERMNGEKDLDLRANEERIKQLKRELEQLQGQRREGQERNGGSNARLQEEYDALKNLVEKRLKPRISELERMNGEKDLDLRANEERIKQLKRELEQLQGQRREGQERNGGSNARLQEEYDALKNLVENRLKPRISELERMNGEKDLDLRANEERIKRLKRELEQLQGQRREGQERNGGSNARLQEEYDALKNLVENRLKPRISALERMNGEKDLDLRANEERIKRLKRELEQLQGQRREGQERNGGSNARLQEEYDALKNLVEKRLKPQISALERMNGEKDLDLRANEETIKKLMEKYKGGHSVIVESGGGIEEIKGERDALLEALMESQESARLREVDLMSFVNSLQDAAERNVAEKEELVASLGAMKSELRKVSKERDVAVADAELLQDEYMKLRDHILAELRPHFADGDGRLLGAYLNEVQRRRAAENELYRGQRGGGATHPNTTVAGSGADRSSITLCLRDMEKVTEDLRSSLEDAMHRLNVAEGCCVKMRSLVPH